MYCCNCGSELDSDNAFCDACGAIIKIDGIIQQNAVSDSPVSVTTGIRGQVVQGKYIVMSVGIVLVMTVITLYTIFGKHDRVRNYSDKGYQNTVEIADLSSGEQSDSYADSSDKNDLIEQSEGIEYSSGHDETVWGETDDENNITDEKEDELEEDEAFVESDNAEFLCEFSSLRLITQEDMDVLLSQNIEGLPDGRELPQMIINEIYAHHGYSFKNELIQDYFEGKEWYRSIGSYSGDMDSIYSGMSEIERDNIKFLEQYR